MLLMAQRLFETLFARRNADQSISKCGCLPLMVRWRDREAAEGQSFKWLEDSATESWRDSLILIRIWFKS